MQGRNAPRSGPLFKARAPASSLPPFKSARWRNDRYLTLHKYSTSCLQILLRRDEIYEIDSWPAGHGAASRAAMTPPIFFLVLLLKHAGGNKRKVIHIKQPAGHAKPSAPRCGDKCMAARREAAYGPTAPKLQGCSPLPYPSLRRYLPKNVTRPEAHPMETPRLADVWAAQKKMAARNGTAEAVVLGGSMPLGQGLRPGIAPWPARLQALLPNLNVEVRATRSTSSAWALGNLARLLPVCPDVLFMDYGVNDAAAIYNAFVPGSAGTGPAIEALSREAKRRCPAAALVHIEGAWNHGEKTREPTVPRLADAQRAVAARYGGIVISFIAGTCYQKTGWFEPHPPPAEHQRLAEQIATAWNAIDAARQAKAKGFGKGPWTLPQRVYNASAELDSCSVTTELASVEKGEKSFRRVDDASKSLWRYEEDVKGRPGFVIKSDPWGPVRRLQRPPCGYGSSFLIGKPPIRCASSSCRRMRTWARRRCGSGTTP